jgi:diguanylate cyclase (GGDEF)-like protein
MPIQLQPDSEQHNSSIMLRVLLAFGGFGGVVIALLELLQGDVLLTIILPLLFSLISVILLFLSRVVKRDGALRGFTVLLYNFVLFPAIWIAGHGFQGPAVMYYLIFTAVMVVLIRRMELLILMMIAFTGLVLLLVVWNPPGFELNRPYDFDYERQFDFIFNLLFSGIILVAIIRVLYNRVQNLEHDLEFSRTQDALTGLYNRRRILELLKAEQLRSSRERSNLSVVVIDIANYSAAVRGLGHHYGEVLIKKIAYIIRNKSRLYDYLGRVHVNGFLSVLPGSSEADGREYIRRIAEEPDLLEDAYVSRGVEIRGKAVEVSNMSYEDLVSLIDTLYADAL